MNDTYRVLVLGSSAVTFTDTGESGTTPAKLRAELARRAPGMAWEVDSQILYPTERMRELAARHLDLFHPDLLLLSMGANTFVERTVVYSIRRRSPLLYPVAARLSRAGKALSGGGAEGSAGIRGTLFRVPRDLARRVLGTASLLDPDAALKATEATFEMLSGRGIPVVVRLAEGNVQQQDQRPMAKKLTATYNAAVREWCRRYEFAVFDLEEELGAAYTRTPDGLHVDDATRSAEAALAAELIADALGLTGDQGPAPDRAAARKDVP